MSTNYVPAIKAKMGDWIYYITKMKFGEVAKQIELAEEIHPNRELDSLIQRELTSRVGAMTEFLLNEDQRFYGSLVVAIYKGNPQFHPIKIDEKHGIVDRVNHSFGLLQMDGSQTYFALDGQHRLESIKSACKEEPDLKEEEISVLVLQHDASKEGMIRTRRLFTKLNRYAKPTDSKTNIAIDEDDCIAISTRRLVREDKLLKDFVKIDASGKQISSSPKDSKYFTTLATMYEMNFEFAKAFQGGTELNKEFLSKRPDDDFLDDLYSYLLNIWKTLFNKSTELKKVISKTVLPGSLRNKTGGSIWMRPIGQLVFAEFIKESLVEDIKLERIITSLNKLPVDLASEPWVNVFWNSGTNRIQGGKSDRAFMVELLALSTALYKPSTSKKDIKSKYGEYHNRASKDLPVLK